MSKLLLAGNWKMNGDLAQSVQRAQALQQSGSAMSEVEWVVCPPYPYIEKCVEALAGTHAVAAQDCSAQASGAYTGQVSAAMLQDIGCTFTLVGHSERRHGLAETDELVAAKAMAAWQNALTPIICVGETLQEREAGNAEEVVQRQLDAILQAKTDVEIARCVIAYEPVWAIGTGKHAAAADVAAMHAFMHSYWQQADAALAAKTQYLYGGSVTPDNAEELIQVDHVDGFLVGGASLDERFFKIGALCCKSFS